VLVYVYAHGCQDGNGGPSSSSHSDTSDRQRGLYQLHGTSSGRGIRKRYYPASGQPSIRYWYALRRSKATQYHCTRYLHYFLGALPVPPSAITSPPTQIDNHSNIVWTPATRARIAILKVGIRLPAMYPAPWSTCGRHNAQQPEATPSSPCAKAFAVPGSSRSGMPSGEPRDWRT
jgi:hypothetical protein